MSIDTIRLELRLDILPNNTIVIPGCEPLTDVSNTLAQRWKCPHVYVELRDVLKAIPEARVEDGSNWGVGYRKKWLVLPSHNFTCCTSYPDWYGVLRSLGSEDEPIIEDNKGCGVIGQGFCPSPGFDRPEKPLIYGQQQDPYLREGETPFGVGVTLGDWVPPWQESDKRTPNGHPYATGMPDTYRDKLVIDNHVENMGD